MTIEEYGYAVNDMKMVYKAKRKIRETEPIRIKSSETSFEVLKLKYQDLLHQDKEYFSVLFLNRANDVMGFHMASEGGITGTVADPRLIMKSAILVGAVGLILCHNHPSGNIKPSRADEELTIKIREIARFLDIKVLDHIILSGYLDSYYSFADEGLI